MPDIDTLSNTLKSSEPSPHLSNDAPLPVEGTIHLPSDIDKPLRDQESGFENSGENFEENREFNPSIHRKLLPFLDYGPRYKAVKGGRSSGKSWGLRDCALARMMSEKITITVCREFQSTIRDSVHRLLTKGIERYGLDDVFHVTDNSIVYKPNGSLLTYKHLHNNVTEVKGLEGTNICWIFEAESLSEESWEILDPTIRSDASAPFEPEIWVEWNPAYEDDFVWQFFVEDQPDNCLLVTLNYDENPHCPEAIKKLADDMRRRDYDKFQNIYMGLPKNTGALIYPNFDDSVHVRDFDIQSLIDRDANFFMGQDPHTSYYPFCVWMARVPRGDGEYDYVVYNEWPTKGTFDGQFYYEVRNHKMCTLSLKARASVYKILDNTYDRTYPGVWMLARGIDTRFAKGSGGQSETLKTRGIIIEMADPSNGGLSFETPPEVSLDVQRDRIRALMEYDTELEIHSFNDAHFFIMPHCENVIDAFKFHRFEKKKERQDNQGQKEKESDKRKDPIDAIRIAMAVASQYDHRTRETHEYTGEDQLLVPSNIDKLQKIYSKSCGSMAGSYAERVLS